MKDTRVLLVEAGTELRRTLSSYLEQHGLQCASVARGEEALEPVRAGEVSIALIDLRLPGIDGIETLKRVRAIDPHLAVVITTDEPSVESAVTSIKEGASDYLVRPFAPDELGPILRKATEHQRLIDENLKLKEQLRRKYGTRNIVGPSARMRRIFEVIDSVAESSATVLIQGESGTGKELIARAIHYAGTRRDRPFITVNCGAIPETLMESELFGYEKGAFTGASKTKTGRFELARDGTLFLDEIGEMSTLVQVDLLRVLQEREFRRVGGTELIHMDARIIASTNRDLHVTVREGKFREDLFYRLNVVPVVIPPLRERQEDIPFLVRHFVDKHRHEARRHVTGVSPEAANLLLAYDWPGNVRELENAVERALVLGKNRQILPEDLPETIHRRPDAPRSMVGGNLALDEVMRLHILSVLEQASWNISQAARVLSITRVTLYRKIEKYGLKAE